MNEPSNTATAEPTSKGLKIERVFSTPTIHPFDQKEWEMRTAEINDLAGNSIFKQENVECPKDWSVLASKIAVSKYFHGDIRKGTDPYSGGRENSIKQLIFRVVNTITTMGLKDGYFASEEDAQLFEQELTWLCVNQYGAFNSPVWFNVGLHHQYGFGKGSSLGNYIYVRGSRELESPGKAERAKTQYEYPQGSACFIQKVQDNMESIMALATSEAMLFKFGSGTGTDLSTLRSSREKLSGGGSPSGPLSFLRIYDNVARVVKSGGKTRRAAKMNILSTEHPDIEEFIDCKSREEKKAWALINAGYSGDFNGEAYDTVSFQNENLSVRATDEFMAKSAFPEDDEHGLYSTIAVTDGRPIEKKHARTMLRKIAEGTHLCGDPGMQFFDIINGWHTVAGTEPIYASNPCSEFFHLDGTACNLASLNLLKFTRPDGTFDTMRFKAAVRIFITAQEIIVDNASYPTPEIAVNSHAFRPLGLGYANLGALIMSQGFGYDSDEGRAMAGAITALMGGEAYAQSAELAKVKGSFPGLNDSRALGVKHTVKANNLTSMKEVLARHLQAATKLTVNSAVKETVHAAIDSWQRANDATGWRNAQVTVLAPTGTIGFLMDCDTTGIEPDLGLVKYKLLAGGGNLKLVNQTVPNALSRLGYSPEESKRIIEHIHEHDTIEDVTVEGAVKYSGLKPEHLSVFDCAFKPANGTRSLHYMGHLRMMAVAQPFLSGAISKTVNLPESATVEEIMDTYTEGWKLGLKAIAIYRDGSKRSAPMTTKKEVKETGSVQSAVEAAQVAADSVDVDHRIEELQAYIATLETSIGQPVRKKMAETRPSLSHSFNIGGHKGYLTIGLFDNGQPGEIFVTMNKEGSTIGGLMDSVATLASIALQYGVPLDSLVRKFSHQRFEPAGWTKNKDVKQATSLVDYIFRWMACQFIPGYREEHAARAYPVEPTLAPKIPDVELPGDIPGLPDDTHSAIPVTPAAQVGSGSGQFLPDPCSNCGSSKVVRAGACGVCTECATSQGCS